MINRTTKICWFFFVFFFQISYQWVFPVQFVLWEQVTGNAMLLPSDRTTMGESLYVQCIKHISNTNSLVCHSVIHWWILINRNIQFKKKLFYYLKTWVTFILGLKKMNTLNTDPEYHGKNQTIPHFALSLKGSISHIYTYKISLINLTCYMYNYMN